MVLLTLLNDKKVAINADMIKMVESTPDTMLTFTNGEKLMVKEELQEVVERIIAYKRQVYCLPFAG